jgi:farnesyl-diphosphate farnesyltransferase
MKSKDSRSPDSISNDKSFIREFIPRVSRTFALAIKFLPPRLRHSVYAAYLLCRVADTIEDSPFIDRTEKYDRLMHLQKLLIGAEKGDRFSEDEISILNNAIIREHGDDHRLLLQSPQLFDILGNLPREQQIIIYHWVSEMALGMAEFSQMAPVENGGIAALKDLSEWDRYCYYVAGTVGQMLTGLFIANYQLTSDCVDGLNRLACSFGLGLQKVNVIKDVPDDRIRGVCFLPLSVMAKHDLLPSTLNDKRFNNEIGSFVIELADLSTVHLDDAMAYTSLFPAHYKGVRMFLTVPILLAVETLNLIRRKPLQTMTGPPVKITRRDVARVVAAATRYSSSNDALLKYYNKLNNKISL